MIGGYTKWLLTSAAELFVVNDVGGIVTVIVSI